MNKRSVIVFAITFFVLCNYLGVHFTQAWFVAGGSLGNGDYTSAKVEYLPTMEPSDIEKQTYGTLLAGSTKDKNVYLIPGDEIIVTPEGGEKPTYLSLENFSTTETSVRIKIDCTLYDSNVSNSLTWQRIGTTDTYQLGTFTDIKDSQGTVIATNVFMGLLEITFANTTVANTYIPNATPPVTAFGNSPYHWNYISEAPSENPDQITFENGWEFNINNTTVVPAIGTDRQYYNAITSLKIIGETANPEYQGAYDEFFTQHYAGKQFSLAIKYFAKQNSYMQWEEFTNTVLNANLPI